MSVLELTADHRASCNLCRFVSFPRSGPAAAAEAGRAHLERMHPGVELELEAAS